MRTTLDCQWAGCTRQATYNDLGWLFCYTHYTQHNHLLQDELVLSITEDHPVVIGVGNTSHTEQGERTT